MKTSYIIASLVLYGLTVICFVLPYKCKQKQLGYLTDAILAAIITFTLIGQLDYLIIFIWPLIVIFQIIFITYWTFRLVGKKKEGFNVSLSLTILFIILILIPWIKDWTFNKNDVRNILAFHNIVLTDDFNILNNEAGGFRNYFETFTIKLTDKDYQQIANDIKSSKYFKGTYVDYTNLPSNWYNIKDTIDYETPNHLNREYKIEKMMDNGTNHFIIQLNKTDKKLIYIGNNY